jgi:hypothetical protein
LVTRDFARGYSFRVLVPWPTWQLEPPHSGELELTVKFIVSPLTAKGHADCITAIARHAREIGRDGLSFGPAERTFAHEMCCIDASQFAAQ